MVDLAGFIKLDFYRFIMIFGFVIFACFLVVPEYFQYKMYSQKVKREASMELINLEIERVDQAAIINNAKAEAALEEFERSAPTREDLNELTIMLDESAQASTENLMAIREKLQTLKIDETMEKYIEERYWQYYIFQWLGVLAGLSMMFFGLYRWYMIQNLLDLKLRKSLDASENLSPIVQASGGGSAN